jgi:hypothetical protein
MKKTHVWQGFALAGALAIAGCKPATSGGGHGDREDLLAHLPADCATGRVFVDWRSIAHHPAFAGHLQALEDKASHAMGTEGQSTARDVLARFREKGLDPARDVESIGMCIRDSKAVVVGVGGDFEDKDLLKILLEVARASGEKKAPPRGEIEGIKYVGDTEALFAQVVPRVFVIATAGEPADLARMADRVRVAKDWRAAEGTMIWAAIDLDAKTKVEMSVHADGDDLVVDGEVVSDEIAKAHASDSDVRKEVAKLADGLAESPLAPLAEDVRALDLKISGPAIHAHFVAPSTHVSKTIDALLRASDAELQRGFRM